MMMPNKVSKRSALGDRPPSLNISAVVCSVPDENEGNFIHSYIKEKISKGFSREGWSLNEDDENMNVVLTASDDNSFRVRCFVSIPFYD